MSKKLNLELINESLEYNSNTGDLIWKIRPLKHFVSVRSCNTWNATYSGKIAGYIHTGSSKSKYKSKITSLNNTQYKCHRLAWAIYYQEQPPEQIDHEDHDATNNRIDNLKASSYSLNRKNVTIQSNNTSGKMGVYFRKDTLKWSAYGNLNGKRKVLGSFSTIKQAFKIRDGWEKENGFHVNHNT